MNVKLEPGAARLDELVTTATGRRRRRDVANDITTIHVDSVLQSAPIRSVSDLLEHRVPDLAVQRTSGAPGDPKRLRLRGAGSPLRNNDPIVIVDGIRMYARQSDSTSANLADHSFAAPSPLDYLDPNSIETIEVIKGPSASTLYGPDAANGVIVITTKKGHAGPTRWQMSAEHGRTYMPGRYPDLLLRWGHEPYQQVPTFCPVLFESSGRCTGDSVVSFQLLNDRALTVLDQGHRTALSLGASGGTQALTYALTGSFSDELGLLKLPDYEAARFQALEEANAPDWMRRPQGFKQWGVSARIGARLGATADVGFTSQLSRSRQQRSDLESQLPDLMSTFLDPVSGHYYRNNLTTPELVAFDYQLANYRQRVTDLATQFLNGLNAEWRPRRWLTLNADAGLDVQQRASEEFLPAPRDSLLFVDPAIGHGRLNMGQGTTMTSTVNLRALASAPLGHGLRFNFGSGLNYNGNSQQASRIATLRVPYGTSNLGTQIDGMPTRVQLDEATFGWYLAPSISHPSFAIDLGLRLDGGSSYGSRVSGLKLPAFPKLGASYLLSDAPFFPLKSLFQSFRVRASYGRAGRQPGLTDRLRLYGAVQQVLGDSTMVDAIALQSLGNTELKPERSSELDGGFDADLLDSRLTLSLTGWRKTTDDALIPIPVPPSVFGANTTITRNIGQVRNSGLSLTADAQLVRAGGITWSTSMTLSAQRSKVVRLAPGVKDFYSRSDGDPFHPGGDRVAAGYPLFGRWALPVLGYADANGDGALEPSEVLYGDTAVYAGRQEPDYELVVRPLVSLGHGALTVSAGLARTGGLSQRNETLKRLRVFSRGTNDPTASLGEQLTTGLPTMLGPFFSTSADDWTTIQTVSSTRLTDLAVRYAVPAAVAQRVGAQRLSLTVQGSNLGLWTNYRGLDPNVNAFSTGNSVADTGVLPQPRTWQLRLDATY